MTTEVELSNPDMKYVFAIKIKEADDKVLIIMFNKEFTRSLKGWVSKGNEPEATYLSCSAAVATKFVSPLEKLCSDIYKIEPVHHLFKRQG
jgi:hypothetical protein